MKTHIEKIIYQEPVEAYKKLRGKSPSFILESDSISDKSGRLSLIGCEPVLELKGKGEHCRVQLLHSRGQVYFDFLKVGFKQYVQSFSEETLEINIPVEAFSGDETKRVKRKNIVQLIRSLLEAFVTHDKNFVGLYGAFSYQFVYLFEEIKKQNKSEEPDFHLFLYDTLLLFNHLLNECSIYCTRAEQEAAVRDSEKLRKTLIEPVVPAPVVPPQIDNIRHTPDEATFMQQVEQARELCRLGELMEIVLSMKMTARIQEDALPVYETYKAINPSPYMFFFDLGDECLLGTSPEMMVRYENGRVQMRPISGSSRRADNPVDEHYLLMELLNSPKEKSELDMLIDLARNDLARVCQPGVKIDHYRIIEKYSHVIHTVAEVSGKLEAHHSGLDALITCLNAGTLTGAPKVAAMQYIENIETHTRGYYGGTIGYLLLNGDINTAITIRSAHIKDGELSYLAGATLLYESEPARELAEVKMKSAAFLKAIKNFIHEYEAVQTGVTD